jgi:hypothetical protein
LRIEIRTKNFDIDWVGYLLYQFISVYRKNRFEKYHVGKTNFLNASWSQFVKQFFDIGLNFALKKLSLNKFPMPFEFVVERLCSALPLVIAVQPVSSNIDYDACSDAIWCWVSSVRRYELRCLRAPVWLSDWIMGQVLRSILPTQRQAKSTAVKKWPHRLSKTTFCCDVAEA